MRISDWSSDVCSSDLPNGRPLRFVSIVTGATMMIVGNGAATAASGHPDIATGVGTTDMIIGTTGAMLVGTTTGAMLIGTTTDRIQVFGSRGGLMTIIDPIPDTAVIMPKIGRAASRAGVCPYVESSWVEVSGKKQK